MIAPQIARVILYVKDVIRVAAFYERFFDMHALPGGSDKDRASRFLWPLYHCAAQSGSDAEERRSHQTGFQRCRRPSLQERQRTRWTEVRYRSSRR